MAGGHAKTKIKKIKSRDFFLSFYNTKSENHQRDVKDGIKKNWPLNNWNCNQMARVLKLLSKQHLIT